MCDFLLRLIISPDVMSRADFREWYSSHRGISGRDFYRGRP